MVEFRKELQSYVVDHKLKLSDRLKNVIRLSNVTYLTDITTILLRYVSLYKDKK